MANTTPSSTPAETSNPGYPAKLAAEELKLIHERRKLNNLAPETLSVGLGLSGGGVRSATFALGVFQGMPIESVLKRVDFLSTVSGGGYWGGCFTSLFARKPDENAWPRIAEHLGPSSRLVPFLRNNGNYLAPNGGADQLLFAAVLMRNWLAVQLMVWTMTVLLWLCCEVPSQLWDEWYPTLDGAPNTWQAMITATGSWLADWTLSPWFLVSVAALGFGMFPLAWAYWAAGASHWVESKIIAHKPLSAGVFSWVSLFEVNFGGILVQSALTTVAAITLEGFWQGVAFWCIAAAYGLEVAARPTFLSGGGLLRKFAGAVAVVIAVSTQVLVTLGLHRLAAETPWQQLLLFVCALPSIYLAHLLPSVLLTWVARHDNPGQPQSDNPAIDRDNYARHNLSVWFQQLALLAALGLCIGLLHTAARVIYTLLSQQESPLWLLLVGGWTSIAAGAERVAKFFSSRASSSNSPKGFQAWMAYAAGLLALLVPLLGSAIIVQAICAESWGDELWLRLDKALFVAAGVGVVIGASRYFLNNSSHLPLYSSRITRTFLGAGPRIQKGGSTQSPTYALPADDLPPGKFWDPRVVTTAGAPLHFINVTVNETVDGRTQLQNKERRGTGMALGPCAVSLGVQHHVINPWHGTSQSACADDYRVFDYPSREQSRFSAAFNRNGCAPGDGVQDCAFYGDKLTIGTWLGISGAAFSTGIGWRTNLGLSLLTGLFNIRLGHWWRSRVHRSWTLTRVLGPFFWVQQYYLRELFARFPGTANSLWYLTDGGHFENMGGYELLRRRCPIVIIVDGEADGKYEFEGLGGLVRKARIDFDTSIEFLSHTPERPELALSKYLHDDVLRYFGDLSHLARGRWQTSTELPLPPEVSGRASYELAQCDESGLSLAHAALARIHYPNEGHGWLIYLKPTLMGEEPQDVCRYHVEHPSFPHETTLDQFFGEAQFESYRCLGQHIAKRIFQHGLPLSQRALDELS